MITKVANFQTSDQASNQQSGAQNKVLDDLSSNPLNNGSLLTAIDLVAGSNDVSHKLGRKLQGWIVVNKSAASDLYSDSSDKTILKLTASAACKVTLFVF